MKCDEFRPYFSEYIDKTLDEEYQSLLEAHFSSCSSCRKEVDEIKRTVLLCNSISPKPLPSDFNLRLNQKLNTAKPGIMVPPWLKNKKLYVSAAAMAACIALVAGPLYTMYQQAGTITEPLPYTVQTALPATAAPTGAPDDAAATGPSPADGQTESGIQSAVTTQQPDSPVNGGGAASSSQESAWQSLPANQPQTPDNGYVQPQGPANSEGAAENPVAALDNTEPQPPAKNDSEITPPKENPARGSREDNSQNGRAISGESDINAVSENSGGGGSTGGSSRIASSIYYYQDKQAYADVLLVNAGSGANALKTWINQNVSALARYSSGPFQVIEVSEAAYQKICEAATTYSAECSVTTSQDSRLQAIRENLSFGYYVVFR